MKTEKQTLVAKLNTLRAKLDNLPPLSEKKIAKMSVGVVKANIQLYEKNVAAF